MRPPIVGILYVVATPIGNLADLSGRAVQVLKDVHCIVAEDTRHSKTLLSHFGIQTPVKSLHEHNEKEKSDVWIERLLSGESIALVSDAGTPLISDPGYHLVSLAKQAGVPVSPIPGACAAIAALSASGLPSDRFVFEGFLPPKAAARLKALETLASENRTLIFYEAPHRVLECLRDLQTAFGENRRAVLAREMTKRFETIRGGALAELIAWVASDENQERGEIVLVVEGARNEAGTPQGLTAEKVLNILLKELPVNQAVKLASEITGEKRNQLYREAVEKKKIKN